MGRIIMGYLWSWNRMNIDWTGITIIEQRRWGDFELQSWWKQRTKNKKSSTFFFFVHHFSSTFTPQICRIFPLLVVNQYYISCAPLIPPMYRRKVTHISANSTFFSSIPLILMKHYLLDLIKQFLSPQSY